jgi:endonuclease/exonuclease/phosphatase family metal-dependent hydrolase
VDQHNESYALINRSGVLKDAYELAPFRLATNGTFNSFDPNGKTDSRIDHIFLSNAFTVKRYGILTDSYRSKKKDTAAGNSNSFAARTPSDHFPVMVEVRH